MSKRQHSSTSSSSSSYISMASMVIFAALCLLGVWMLTTSSIVSSSRRVSRATAAGEESSSAAGDSFFAASRASLFPSRFTPPPSLLLRDPADLPTDAGRGGDGEGSGEAAEEETPTVPVVAETDGDGREEDSEFGGGGGDEEKQQERQLEQEQEQNQVLEEGTRQEHQVEDGRDDQQHQDQQLKETGGEQEEEQGNRGGDDGVSEENADGKSNDDSHHSEQNADGENIYDNHHQQQIEEETQSESQSNEEADENQQQSRQQEPENEGYENHHQQQQHEEGESNENQEESHLEQSEARGDENQLQPQQKMEERGTEEQEQSLQQTESEENQEEASRKETEEEGGNAAGEESQQQGVDEKPSDDPNVSESLPDGAQLEASNGSDGKKMPWSTQADHSDSEKERRREESHSHGGGEVGNLYGIDWKLCNVTAGPDYIPCLDNVEALRHVPTRHYEHRERHCPREGPTCLVPLPKGYRRSVEWPRSRDKIWYNNVPHTKLAVVKGHQNWVKVTGEFLTFPGGGTQFIHGALHYIDFIQKAVHEIAWGKRTRVILDVGCGVASFGGFLFEKDALAMSFAPKDEHEAQVQLALERGIPAISAVMGSQRLPFPSRVFDLVHCARCRVPWHADGGALLLELNRVLRPGGYFVWSATPVYQKLKEDVEIWKAMTSLTISMCWDLITIKKDRLNSVGAAIYRKPISNECYDNRKHHSPPMCKEEDDPNAAWYIPLQSCMHRVPTDASERGSQWPAEWPRRLQSAPYWLNGSQMGVYGKPVPDDFSADYEHWKRVVTKSYLSGMGISWSKVRNVMDMRAVYGGFAAALKDLKVWVMNVVNIDSPDTLPIIYERGFFGIYHDWCESFSTYPRTYDLLHADHLFSRLKKRCDIVHVMAEVDRIARPGGKIIVRDESTTINDVQNLLKSLHWDVRLTFSKGQEGILCAEKSDWRPETFSDTS